MAEGKNYNKWHQPDSMMGEGSGNEHGHVSPFLIGTSNLTSIRKNNLRYN